MARTLLLLVLVVVLGRVVLAHNPSLGQMKLPPAIKRYDVANYVIVTDLGETIRMAQRLVDPL